MNDEQQQKKKKIKTIFFYQFIEIVVLTLNVHS